MNPCRFANRYSVAAALTGLVLVLLVLGVFRLKEQERIRTLEQLADRQARLTDLAAAHLTHHLEMLQQGLGHLSAKGGALLRDSTAAEADLGFLADNYPERFLVSLYIRDGEGNIPAEFPPGKLASAPFPPHLLPDNPDLFTPILLAGAKPFILLGQPILEEKVRLGELVAVISLEGLRDACIGSLQEQPGACLLLDENGAFLLHPDPSMVGRSFAAAIDADRQPDLFGILSAMHKGERGTGRYRNLFLNADPTNVEIAPENLLTYTPLRVPGARWSLATALPSSILTEIDRSDAGFRLAFSLGLILASILAAPAVRFYLNARALAAERERCRHENGRMIGDLDLAERRYRHLLDNAGDAIFFIEPHSGALQEINRQMEELLGYSAEEIRTLSLEVLFPGWQRRRYLRLVKRVLKDGYGEEYNLLFRRKDGQLFAGAVHARLGDLGTAQVVHGTVRDITELKRIEQELRQKNRDLTLINEIAHRAAASRNLKEMLQAVLAQVVQAFGADGGGIYLVEENGMKNLELAAQQEIGDELLKDLRRIPFGIGLVGRVAASGQSRTSADLRKDHRVRSGHVLEAGWRGFQAIPMSTNERTVGVLFLFCYGKRTLSREEIKLLLAIGKQVGTSVEGARLFEALQWQHRLTEASNRELEFSRQQLKNNLMRVEESNRLLEQLERMKSNFLALASHELRTPLTYILPSTEFLSQRLDARLDADEKRFLEAIELGGKRLNEIVNDLLEVARLESRNLYLGRESIDLPALVREVGADFLPILAERELTFTIGEFPHPLPLVGDPDYLRKTVRRLVENAVKFTPPGGGIEIEAVQRTPAEVVAMEPGLSPFSPSFFRKDISDRFLQMTVRDTGIGIDPEEQLRIFDKFYEVGDFGSHFTSQTRFGGKGVGLGLTLVRGMVEAHGGMVWVESEGADNDGGSAFHVLLPFAPAAAGEEPHATD